MTTQEETKFRHFLRKGDANRCNDPLSGNRSSGIGHFSKCNSHDLRDVGCDGVHVGGAHSSRRSLLHRLFSKKSDNDSSHKSKKSHVMSPTEPMKKSTSVTKIRKTPRFRRSKRVQIRVTSPDSRITDETKSSTWNCQTIVPISKCQVPHQNAMDIITNSLNNVSMDDKGVVVAAEVHQEKPITLRPFRPLGENTSHEHQYSGMHSPWNVDLRELGGRDQDDAHYTAAHYQYLLSYEKTTAVENDFLSNGSLSFNDRAILNNWLIKVQVYLRNTMESVHLTAAICDYFLSMNRIHSRQYQLVVITAYFTSVKIVERYHPSVKRLCYLTQDQYKEAEVFAFEKYLLHHIRYRVLLVTPLQLMEHMIRACVELDEIQLQKLAAFCRYLFDLLLVDKVSAFMLPSLRTAAALFYGRAVLFPLLDKWPKNMECHTGFAEKDLLPCAGIYAKYVHEAGKGSPFSAAYEKFSDHKHNRIAQCPEISSSTFLRPQC